MIALHVLSVALNIYLLAVISCGIYISEIDRFARAGVTTVKLNLIGLLQRAHNSSLLLCHKA